MWVMGLFGLIILAGVIVLIVWAIRTMLPSRSSDTAQHDANPLLQLQGRLARGEITPAQYEEIREQLRP